LLLESRTTRSGWNTAPVLAPVAVLDLFEEQLCGSTAELLARLPYRRQRYRGRGGNSMSS
jgi:hypothetical protein